MSEHLVEWLSPQRAFVMRGWIAETAFHLYRMLEPVYAIAFLVTLFVFVPLGFFRRTRKLAGSEIYFVSYIFGATVWLLSAAITFSYFGWLGLIIGLLLLGVGVVVLAFVAALLEGAWYLAFGVIGLYVVLTYGARMLGTYLSDKTETERRQAKRDRLVPKEPAPHSNASKASDQPHPYVSDDWDAS